MGTQEETVVATPSVKLVREDMGTWRVFRLVGEGPPGQEDLDTAIAALNAEAARVEGPVCFAPDSLGTPKSRALAALVGLLSKADGSARHVALATGSGEWADMLEVLGVRSSFLIVGDPAELASG